MAVGAISEFDFRIMSKSRERLEITVMPTPRRIAALCTLALAAIAMLIGATGQSYEVHFRPTNWYAGVDWGYLFVGRIVEDHGWKFSIPYWAPMPAALIFAYFSFRSVRNLSTLRGFPIDPSDTEGKTGRNKREK